MKQEEVIGDNAENYDQRNKQHNTYVNNEIDTGVKGRN